MILQISIDNFKSINKTVTFSLLAGNDDLHQQFVRSCLGFKVLPASLIIGTNGAGKSNFFLAIQYLKDLLLNKNPEIEHHPHKLYNRELTQIDIQFIYKNVRYAYGIDVKTNEVLREYLYTIDDETHVIFMKENETVVFAEAFSDELLIASKKGLKGHPLLQTLSECSENQIIRDAYEYLTEQVIVIAADYDEKALFDQMLKKMHDEKNLKVMNEMLSKLDIGLTLSLEENDVAVQYENMVLSLNEESSGNRKLVTLLALFCDALNSGKTIFIDELERNLHISLVKYLIALFNNPDSNNQKAQLVFSTHNTSLLNLRLFRRDQVWFIEKDLKTLSTDLYSLYSIMDVQNNEDVEKGYILGKYGATFNLNIGGENDESK